MKAWDSFVIGLYGFTGRYKGLFTVPAIVAIITFGFVPVSIGLTKTLMWLIWQVCGFESVSTMTLFYAGGAWGAWVMMGATSFICWLYDEAHKRLYATYLDALSRRNRGY